MERIQITNSTASSPLGLSAPAMWGNAPQHVKSSRAYYQQCSGTALVFEEITDPASLSDEAFFDKDKLMARLRYIARETMREELVKVIEIYFNRGTHVCLISNQNHELVGLGISEVSFENDDKVLTLWLQIYLPAYQGLGLVKSCFVKAMQHAISRCQAHYCLKGAARLLPYFSSWTCVSRTFNPVVYASFVRPFMTVSPRFDESGRIKKQQPGEKELRIRRAFLGKLGLGCEQMDNASLFVIKAFDDEPGNRRMQALIKPVAHEAVNRFFHRHLGLDRGNLLVQTACSRPALLVGVNLLLKIGQRLMALLNPACLIKPRQKTGSVQRI